MSALVRILSVISDALLVPVVATLLLCAALTIFLLGRLAREAWDRARIRRARRGWLDGAQDRAGALAALRALRVHPSAPRVLVRFADATLEPGPVPPSPERIRLRLDRVLDEVEGGVATCLARSAVLVRLGPMLGLMGTLIPMGPALRALAGGDLTALSQSLVVAFTTTVLGLAIGAVASLLTTVRTRWYAADLSDAVHLAACLDIEETAKPRNIHVENRTTPGPADVEPSPAQVGSQAAAGSAGGPRQPV